MNSIEITKQLIAIPSYVNEEANEARLGEYIYQFLKKIKKLNVIKQQVDKNRFNVIATAGIPSLWLCGHMDTVEPKSKNQLIPLVKDGKLYGLGAIDMKAGIAAILEAVLISKNLNNIGLLFYCDEEYGFAGMKTFIKTFKGNPKLAIIAEPTNLFINNAHRGLIEFDAIVKGKTGHASRPREGVNAIWAAAEATKQLSKVLRTKYKTRELGETSCTLSKLTGGTQIDFVDKKPVFAKGTNSIPDTAIVSIDIRPAKVGLKADEILLLFNDLVEKQNCKLENVEINADFGSLYTSKDKLKTLETATKSIVGQIKYEPAKKMGYGDGQMLFEKTGCPVAYFGPGPSSECHQANEYADINSIEKTAKVFIKLIEEYV